MSKKICSLLIIIFTFIYVFSVLEVENSFVKRTFTKVEAVFYNIKNIDLKDSFNLNRKSNVIYDNKEEPETSVLNNSTVQRKSSLAEYDKERLLSMAKELPYTEQDKIKNYLDSNTENEVKEAINLFKKRLSDKEYEKIKDLEMKYNKTNNNK